MPVFARNATAKHLKPVNSAPKLHSNRAIENESLVHNEAGLKEQLLSASSPSIAAEIVTLLAYHTTPDCHLLLRLDANNVDASELAPRHGASFVTTAFADLKKSIHSTNGNQQPVFIQIVDQRLEIVFGHRRHKACLELGLPLFAIVWPGTLSKNEAFAYLERENEFRTSLAPFEKGCLFKALVLKNVFPSFRALADYIHMSHTAVNAVVKVANLHEVVIKAFGDPCSITTKYADEITKAWETDRASILFRARELCDSPPEKRLSPKKILEYLLKLAPEVPTPAPLVKDKPHLGSWEKTTDGQVLVRLPASTTSTIINEISRLVQLADLRKIASEVPTNPPLSGNRVSTVAAVEWV